MNYPAKMEYGAEIWRNGEKCKIISAPYKLYGAWWQDAESCDQYTTLKIKTIRIQSQGNDAIK